ncbi:MAG: hypothetical protein E7316_07715 [Clostridiales bacterium]|nr:hypothetical protein [Clostridiales bacterium]
MHMILCLIPPLIALLMLSRRWGHPWRLRLPLFSLDHAAIDSTLLVEPRRMTAAHLPFEATAQPRLQSGALLWASAATVTHSLAGGADQAAILAAVKPLGFTPEKFLARCPILQAVEQNGLRGYIVRDGNGQRAYFLGEPVALLAACAYVWEQEERVKTPQDAERIPRGEGLYGLAMAPVENGCPGPMTYLGSLQITAPAMDPSVVEALLPPRWRLSVGLTEAPPAALRISSQPEGMNCFTADSPDWMDRLAEGFTRSRVELRQLVRLLTAQLILGFAGLVWQVPAWLVPVAGLLLLPIVNAPFTPKLSLRHIAALVWALMWPVAIGCFMRYAAPESSGLMLALIASAACVGTVPRSWRITLPCAAALAALTWLIFQPELISAAFCLIAGVLLGLPLRLLYPMECS